MHVHLLFRHKNLFWREMSKQRNAVSFQVNEKALSLWPVTPLHSNTPLSYLFFLSAALPELMQLCKNACVYFFYTRRFIWPVRASRLQGRGHSVRLCVCIMRSDVCRAPECINWVKLCLLSFIDPPLELTLIIHQVLHHEGRLAKKCVI